MILKGCQVIPVCPEIADTTFISRVGATGFLEYQRFYQSIVQKLWGKKREQYNIINAHHMTNHMPPTFLKPYFQGTLVEELMENITAHFI